jgi:hypothetical protein
VRKEKEGRGGDPRPSREGERRERERGEMTSLFRVRASC